MKNNRGNALFFVLIGIALFAALTYAATNTGSSSSTVEAGEAKILAAEAAQWFNHVQEHYNEARGLKGYADDEMHFVPEGHGWNTRCPDQGCKLLSEDGGPVTEFNITDPDFYMNGYGGCSGVPTYADGPKSATEIYVTRVLGLGDDTLGDVYIKIDCVTEEVCKAFNDLHNVDANGIPLDPSEGRRYDFVGVDPGDFPEPDPGSDIGDDAPELKGKRSFCRANGYYGGKQLELIRVVDPR